VGATDLRDTVAGFSQFGNWISVTAPGVNIYSTLPTYKVALNDNGFARNYDYLDGTSMATPAAAGMVADVLARFPGITPAKVKSRVEASADKVGGLTTFDNHYGNGRINVLKAVSNP
jgi:subtilisin family serine protease